MRCRQERSPRWPCSSRARRRALSPAQQSTPSAPQIHCSEAEAAASGDAGFTADGLHRSTAIGTARFGALNFETQAGEEFSADGSAKYRRINGLPNVTLMFGCAVRALQ